MITSPAKRRSVHGYTLGIVYPLADNSISAADRANIAWLYSGLFIPDSEGGGLLALLSLTPVLGGTLLLIPVVAAMRRINPALLVLKVESHPVFHSTASTMPVFDIVEAEFQVALEGASTMVPALAAVTEWHAALDGEFDTAPAMTALPPEMVGVLAGEPQGKAVLDSSGET